MIRPWRDLEFSRYARDGVPWGWGIVWYRVKQRRVTIAWLGINLLIRWLAAAWRYLRFPGACAPAGQARLEIETRRLARKAEALSRALTVHEPVLQAARRLSGATVSQWPALVAKLSKEVERAERETWLLYREQTKKHGS